MASSSISSIQKSFKYDLFISFRGEDTRRNFVDHLYHALQRQGIHTFKDDNRLKKGQRIDNELIKAIEDSKFYIIVLSKNYASSSWCLDELVKIMECQKTSEHTAYPIFYNVEPSEVRKQSGEFGEAFDKYKSQESFGKWKLALKEAADLSGWDLARTADRHEAKFIKKVVKQIFQELRSVNFCVDEKLVGMERRIKDVEQLLDLDSNDVQMIGIKGIGGGGKTTLARALFNKLASEFEAKSFVENVREASQDSLTGLKSLQKQVLSDVTNDKDINVNSVYDGKNMIKKRLSSGKVLLVLDDVNHLKQLESLAEPSWFMGGSIIIITTRDEQVLVAHGVKLIHNVNLLSDDEATCLLSRYAVQRDIHGFKELTCEVVRYVAGLPLTTKVLGSFLCGKTEIQWEDALKRLKTIPENETKNTLELSYADLEDDYKEIFLNVACFMKGWGKNDAKMALESLGFHAINGLQALQQKCLITISQNSDDDEHIDVHDLIKEMARDIVRRINRREPNTHSRLWNYGEVEDILANNSGAKETKYIDLESVKSTQTFMKGFGDMEKLIYLRLCGSLDNGTSFEDGSSSNYMKIDQVKQFFPNSLKYLQWDGYHHRFLPRSFEANNLVALNLTESKIERLWEDGEGKVLKQLKFLDLSYSDLKTLDLEMTPNLESLDLMGCANLEKLDMQSEYLLNLKSLYLSDLELRTIIDLRLAQNLEILSVEGSYAYEILMPPQCVKLRYLELLHVELRTLDLEKAKNLETLRLQSCHMLVKLYLPPKCQNLTSVCVMCDNLLEFHMPNECGKLKSLTLHLPKSTTCVDLGCTEILEYLHLDEFHNVVEVQELITRSPKLKDLEIHNSNLRTLDLRLSENLVKLHLKRCPELVVVNMPVSCLELRSLVIHVSKIKIPEGWRTPKLHYLKLEECHNLEVIQALINGSGKLKYLTIINSNLKTVDLGFAQNLSELHLEKCPDLIEVKMPDSYVKHVSGHLNPLKSKIPGDDVLTLNLEYLSLKDCPKFVEVQALIDASPMLKYLKIIKSNLKSLHLGPARNLEELHLEECSDIVEFYMPISCLKLRSVHLNISKLRALELGTTPKLEERLRVVPYECESSSDEEEEKEEEEELRRKRRRL